MPTIYIHILSIFIFIYIENYILSVFHSFFFHILYIYFIEFYTFISLNLTAYIVKT